MTKDPNRPNGGVVTVYICEACNTRYSLEEAKERDMMCCGKPLKQIEKDVSIPLGP